MNQQFCCASCVLMLMKKMSLIQFETNRGHLRYDALVKEYWPEFGRNGKDNITVEMMLSHQGGLEKAQFKTTFDDIGDHERMSKLLSDMTPTWPPGRNMKMSQQTSGIFVDNYT